MELITVSELLGVRVKKIHSGSELLFLYELHKYCKTILNKKLTIEDAQILKSVREGEHFAYVYNMSDLNLNYTLGSDEVLANYKETGRKYFSGDFTVTPIALEKQELAEWVYTYNTDKRVNIVLNGYNRSAAYVSLYAYMLVTAYSKGQSIPLLRLINSNHEQPELEYVDLLILMHFGNTWLKNKVVIEYAKKIVVQPEWEAFIIYNRQNGNMLRESNIPDKYKYMQKNFKVGDVVLYYTKEKPIQSKSIRKLTGCYPAVVMGITKEGLKLKYYPITKTLLTRQRNLEEVESNVEGFKYSEADYKLFTECEKNLDYSTTGIDVLTYTEEYFVMKAMNGIEEFPQYLVGKDGVEKVYMLDTLNTIYAVFEDRGVNYSRERFLETHFKKTLPIYDAIR